MDEKGKAFLRRAPKWRKEDIEAINGLFKSYIFIRRKTGEVWGSCCGKHEVLPHDHNIWLCEHVPEPRFIRYCHMGAMSAPRPPKKTACPFCGREGTVKELRYTGRRKNLWEEQRFILLRYHNGALWALGAWAYKDYENVSCLALPPTVRSGPLYRFGKKMMEHLPCNWYCDYGHYECRSYVSFDSKTVDSPFSYCSMYGSGYRVLGLEALEKSDVRYCHLGDYGGEDDGSFIKALHLAHVYPRQVEMLMKAGMDREVYDLAKRGVKHARVLDWKQTDPRKAWKVTPSELRDFLDLTTPERRPIGILELYRSLKKEDVRFTVRDACGIYEATNYSRCTLRDKAKEWGLTAYKLWRYLDRSGLEPRRALYAWLDYTKMAGELGYQLHRESVLLPKNLGEAHDEALQEHIKQRDKERWEQAERERLARKEGYAAIKEGLQRRYEIEAEGYLIRVPAGEEEIVAEGKALMHCVGGYAKRHVAGKTVILFLRDARRPEKPYITIEMDGGKLRQIHGYKNEGVYSADGRKAPDPRITFSWLIDPWLDWIRRGSRRDKDGRPKGLHIIKEAKTA